MFSLHDFILDGLMRAVGYMADYQIILNAVGWHQKAVLTTDDLEKIAVAIQDKEAEMASAVEEATAAFDDASSVTENDTTEVTEESEATNAEAESNDTGAVTTEDTGVEATDETDAIPSENEADPA